MATFNNSSAYSILNTQKGIYYVQGGHYFSPTTFVDLGTTAPSDYQSLSSERSDQVSITGGALDGVTVGPNSTINASVSGNVTNATITGPTITGGTINGTPIGQTTPAAGAFTGLNATSVNIIGPMSAEGVNSSSNGQPATPTNTGTAMSSGFAMMQYYDSARTANNRTADFLWTGGTFAARFKNDAANSVVTWLSASGGQAAGITGITSTSGTGSWAHTGNFTVQTGAISSSAGAGIASPTNSGVNLNFGGNYGMVSLYDSTRSANNRAADLLFISGAVNLRFANDAYSAFATALSVAGGQAGGVTSIAATTANTSLTLGSNTITSNSGTGDWVHTGTLKTTGVVTLSQGFTVAGLPAASTALKGARAFVTDSANPTYNSQVVGGGANAVPVFCNGNVWVWA